MSEEDKERLRVLLEYWIEHNKEHSEEFREWAKKAEDFNKQAVSDNILVAAGKMDEVNAPLSVALEDLKG